MNAEERLNKIREHLEIAFNHDKFGLEEKVNLDDKVVVDIEMYFDDRDMCKEFTFKNENIISVREVKDCESY